MHILCAHNRPVYYRYLNAHGKGTGATAFLFVVAILDAGRNALSFFMLLVVSLGLSVVRESLGSTMIRCQVLTGAHFIFGGEPLPVPHVHGLSGYQYCTRLGSSSLSSSLRRPWYCFCL
jgi:hypothetical protein